MNIRDKSQYFSSIAIAKIGSERYVSESILNPNLIVCMIGMKSLMRMCDNTFMC